MSKRAKLKVQKRSLSVAATSLKFIGMKGYSDSTRLCKHLWRMELGLSNLRLVGYPMKKGLNASEEPPYSWNIITHQTISIMNIMLAPLVIYTQTYPEDDPSDSILSMIAVVNVLKCVRTTISAVKYSKFLFRDEPSWREHILFALKVKKVISLLSTRTLHPEVAFTFKAFTLALKTVKTWKKLNA